MTNNIQCSIESSTTKIELNSAVEGVFLVPELEGLAGLPEIRTTSGVNAGYDGGWTSAQNYDARLISIRGVIANPDVAQVEAKRRAIASLLGQGRKEQLTLRLTTEAGNSYAISVRTISCEMALQRVLTTQEFLIQLRADDPLIYDDGASAGTEAILHVQRALGGFEIDFELPLAIGGGAESTIVQNGEEMVYPIIKLYGPLHSPTVVNTTTNQQMQLNADLQYTVNWSGYETESGDYITLNDGVAGAPMSLIQLDGNATQTTYSGKNLCAPASIHNGAFVSTQSFENEQWTETGNTKYRSIKIDNLPAGTYTASINWNYTARFLRYYHDGVITEVGTDRNTYTFTTTTNGAFGFCFRNTASSDFADSAYTIQLEAGSTATAYEPYVGGTASPNPDYPQAIETVTGGQTIEIVPEQKNLANPQKFIDWINRTYNLCVQYSWGSDSTRPAYGEFNGRANTVRYAGSTLYSSRGSMTNPTYNEAIVIYEGIFEEGEQYTFSADVYSAANNGAPNLCFNYTDGSVTYFNTGVQNQWYHASTTSVAGKTVKNIAIAYQSSVDACIDLSTLQIEKGTQATAYEPYQGQEYEVNLGKNLFDKSTITTGKRLGSDGSLVSDSGFFTSDYITITPSATYAYSRGATGSANSAICFFDGSKTFISRTMPIITATALSGTITTPANAYFARLCEKNDSLDSAQLELGSTATTYAPYFTPIELAKIGTYQDRIYKDDGKWYIEKQVGKVVLDGTETIVQNPYGTNSYKILMNPSASGTPTSDTLVISDSFTGTPYTSRTSGLANMIYAEGDSDIGYVTVRNTTFTSLANFQTWLGTDKPTVYYALGTPTDTEITDDTLLAQLNTISELYGGQNNISIVPSMGAQGTMIVSYATEYTVDQDVAVIDSQARTITINGQDAYHLKTPESEFLLLAPGENKLYLTSATETDEGYAEVKFKQGYLSI